MVVNPADEDESDPDWIDDSDAEELAIEYLTEIGWFADPEADNFPDYVIRSY